MTDTTTQPEASVPGPGWWMGADGKLYPPDVTSESASQRVDGSEEVSGGESTTADGTVDASQSHGFSYPESVGVPSDGDGPTTASTGTDAGQTGASSTAQVSSMQTAESGADYVRKAATDALSGLDAFRWLPSATKAPTTTLPVLGSSEVVKRHWVTSRLWRPLGKFGSAVTLTDARVLYVTEATNLLGSSRTTFEVQLEEVAGVRTVSYGGLRGWRLPLLTVLCCYLFLTLTSVGSDDRTPLIGWFGGSGSSSYSGYESSGAFGSFSNPSLLTWLIVAMLTMGVFISGLLDRRLGIHILRADGQSSEPIMLPANDGLLARFFTGLLRILTWPVTLVLLPALGIFDVEVVHGRRPTHEAQRVVDEIGAAILNLRSRGVLGE